ncbi:hypothetical protein ACFL6X_03140 [Candidatus Latescibacterota bacterium]
MSRSLDPPRKVALGTLMYAMWVECPGLGLRLDGLLEPNLKLQDSARGGPALPPTQHHDGNGGQ